MELDHRNGKKEKQKGYREGATYLHTPCTRIKGIGVLVPK